jgi:hypothetical protein
MLVEGESIPLLASQKVGHMYLQLVTFMKGKVGWRVPVVRGEEFSTPSSTILTHDRYPGDTSPQITGAILIRRKNGISPKESGRKANLGH